MCDNRNRQCRRMPRHPSVWVQPVRARRRLGRRSAGMLGHEDLSPTLTSNGLLPLHHHPLHQPRMLHRRPWRKPSSVPTVGHCHYRGRVADEDDLAEEIWRKIQARFPSGVSVPLGVSEDEAVRAVRDQFREAGLDCSAEAAREIVGHARHK
jgi:hypothetical protein